MTPTAGPGVLPEKGTAPRMEKYTSQLLEGERRVPGWKEMRACSLLPGIYPRETLSCGHRGVC